MEKNKFPIGYSLTGISVVEDDEFEENALCLSKVELFFEETSSAIILYPLTDTDEIEINHLQVTEINNASPKWCSDLVGKKLQTVWSCENSQGYRDQIIFAFEFLHPSLTFLSEGSVLKAFRPEMITKI